MVMKNIQLSDEDNYVLHTYFNVVQEFQKKLEDMKMTSFGLQDDNFVYFAGETPIATAKWHLIGEFIKEFDEEAQTEHYIFTWAHSRPEAKEYDQLKLSLSLTEVPLFADNLEICNSPYIKFNDYMMLNLIMSKVHNRTGFITQCYESTENMSAIFALSDINFVVVGAEPPQVVLDSTSVNSVTTSVDSNVTEENNSQVGQDFQFPKVDLGVLDENSKVRLDIKLNDDVIVDLTGGEPHAAPAAYNF